MSMAAALLVLIHLLQVLFVLLVLSQAARLDVVGSALQQLTFEISRLRQEPLAT